MTPAPFPDDHFDSCVHHCVHAYRTAEPAVVMEIVLSYADLITSDMIVAGAPQDEVEIQVEGFLDRVEAEMIAVWTGQAPSLAIDRVRHCADAYGVGDPSNITDRLRRAEADIEQELRATGASDDTVAHQLNAFRQRVDRENIRRA